MNCFIYFEDTEGGMEPRHIRLPLGFAEDEGYKVTLPLRSWMEDDCSQEDNELVAWMETADVGEYYYHRLGVMVRVKDEELSYDHHATISVNTWG